MSTLDAKFREFRAAVARVNALAAEIVRLSPDDRVRGYVPAQIQRIQLAVAAAYELPPSVMQSAARPGRVAEARHVAMWLSRTHTRYTFQAIGAAFCRSHDTVIYAVRSVDDRMAIDAKFRAHVAEISGAVVQELRAA